MRQLVLSLFLLAAVLVPKISNAQVILRPTEPPQVTAAGASWQVGREPVFYAGDYYYPVGPTVFFDGNVMARAGTYRGVPLYADSTLEPYSIVFVPIGGKLLRPYERKRTRELAGTVGSRTPSFPIQREVEVSAASSATGIQWPPLRAAEDGPAPVAEAEGPVGTAGTIVPSPVPSTLSAPIDRRSTPMRIETIPGPRSNAGVWVEYSGARWYVAGPAVMYAPERFTPIGRYYGLVVYREANGTADRIYVPSVRDGPLVPYRR